MGNKLSCACAPFIPKTYGKYDNAPWQTPRRRDGHLLRLWAEVFHVTTSSGGNTKWQQVSEDLVPVNITCVQDSPEYFFHITAYNSQVDKILDVRLVQPGTRIGQASDCFIYWKDPLSNDMWGLNFTSPIDAKQFRECCSPSFKFSRKASSSYSLKLEPPHKQKIKTKRKPVSTPVSPNKNRDPQCTCMTGDLNRTPVHELKSKISSLSSSTLPKTQTKATELLNGNATLNGGMEKSTIAASSSTSLYDNVINQPNVTKKEMVAAATAAGKPKSTNEVGTMTTLKGHIINVNSRAAAATPGSVHNLYSNSQISDTQLMDTRKSEGTQAGDSSLPANVQKSFRKPAKFANIYAPKNPHTQSLDQYTNRSSSTASNQYENGSVSNHRPKSRSIDYMSDNIYSDNEVTKRKHYIANRVNNNHRAKSLSRGYPGRGLYLELDNPAKSYDQSPPSDNVLFDNQCYATTPTSSNNNSDCEQMPDNQTRSKFNQRNKMSQTVQNETSTSPTSRLLLEYEMHLRNTLAKGMDAESYSLHTFEALLSQSMENLEFAESIPFPKRRGQTMRASTLPSSHRSFDRVYYDKDRDGYLSDRNEFFYDKRRENDREKGYLSDHNTSYNDSKCASCIGASSRAQWFRHSDGWRSASSSFGSNSNMQFYNQNLHSQKRSPWDSLPSLRHDNSLGDSGYKSNRTDSFEQSERESRYGILHQVSVESSDSRLCYLTSSEISDDDRMSLTTAISDDEERESGVHSPFKVHKSTATPTASFNCTGAVRKAGFLSVKKWLLRKKNQIELARKRGWKGYWVCLKGTTLLFYPCDSRDGRSVDAAPKHLIIVDGAIMQAIPEHPKRDYIFCLSTAFGDAYLFQAPCQIELDNWINSIHSACAAAFARHRGKTGTLNLLQEEVYRLEKTIESEYKMKHMADLQQSVLNDMETKQHILGQIMQWEENLERFHCEQFRLRCYMASLQYGELPNPKCLLTHVSRPTKSILNKLGVFTVSSFHAFICARSPSLLNNLLAGRGAIKRRAPLLSRSNSASSKKSLQNTSVNEDGDKNIKVLLPDATYISVYLQDTMTTEEFLANACFRKNLNPAEYFLRVKKRREMDSLNYFVPDRNDVIENYIHTHEVVELCAKIVYQVDLARKSGEYMWGFSVEAELVENMDRQDELCVYVSRVEDKSVAMKNGIIKGDEIMVINTAIVSDLDMMYIESVLQEELVLSMIVRSSRTEPPELTGMIRSTDDIEQLVCPPPPSNPNLISEEMISELIVPAPSKDIQGSSMSINCSISVNDSQLKSSSRVNSFEIENLLKSAEQVTGICRSPESDLRNQSIHDPQKSSGSAFVSLSMLTTPASNLSSGGGGSGNGLTTAPNPPTISSSISHPAVTGSLTNPSTNGKPLTDADKLRKAILELIETERIYVKNLSLLLENYLEPLKREKFLSNNEIDALFGNINEISCFQKEFLRNLNESLEFEHGFENFENPNQFKSVLFSIGNAFLYYVNQFKLYSSFCASHSKAQKVLHPNEGNQALQEFLASRNPKQQHSSTLESFLIKPIQRILKYPLLLQQLKSLTNPASDEHQHLSEALKGMEKVAEHINEMQRIHEEYGAIFDHLLRQHQKSFRSNIDLNPGELHYYGGVEWLNITDFLGKIKKGLELHAMCFVFKSAVVFLCKERHRQRKKVMGVTTKSLSNTEVEVIRYQVLIPVSEVQVRTSTAKDVDKHYLWELIHLQKQVPRRSEKVYLLSNSSCEFRNAFLKTIRQIIRDSVRNMLIPSSRRLSLSDSGSSLAAPGGSSRAATAGSGSASATKDTVSSLTLERPTSARHTVVVQGSSTVGKVRSAQQRHSAGNIQMCSARSSKCTSRSADHDDDCADCGHGPRSLSLSRQPQQQRQQHRSDDSDTVVLNQKKTDVLGKTPNYLTLSTTSTLSASSNGSQAKLIQASNQPENFLTKNAQHDLGSPIWKPRDSSITFFETNASKSVTIAKPSSSNHNKNNNDYATIKKLQKPPKNK